MPARTKHETSAMCTQARIPSRSRRNESASSKSLALSGSIVIVGRSRRSTRPSRSRPAARTARSPRAPRSTSSASSTFSIRRAVPIARSTRARPRPGRTTARSPVLRPPKPFVSSTSGAPGGEVRLAGDQLPAPADLDDEQRGVVDRGHARRLRVPYRFAGSFGRIVSCQARLVVRRDRVGRAARRRASATFTGFAGPPRPRSEEPRPAARRGRRGDEASMVRRFRSGAGARQERRSDREKRTPRGRHQRS